VLVFFRASQRVKSSSASVMSVFSPGSAGQLPQVVYSFCVYLAPAPMPYFGALFFRSFQVPISQVMGRI